MHSNQILACVAHDMGQSFANRRLAQVALSNPFDGLKVAAIISKLEAEINDPATPAADRAAMRRLIAAYRRVP